MFDGQRWAAVRAAACLLKGSAMKYKSNHVRWLALLGALLLMLAACGSDDSDASDDSSADVTSGDSTDGEGASGDSNGGSDGNVLAGVQDAGVVRCGTRDALPGFSVLEDDGSHVGFDADFCRVIAAAVLGDAEAVEFVDLETEARFTALQSGEIDVLVRNTTWTASRDGVEAATFLQPNFYDGQGMMVATDSGIEDLDGLAGAVVCVAAGTTIEGNVANEFARLGLDAPEIQSFEDTDLIQEAFQQGRCDGWSSDVSQLASLRSDYPDGPDALTILDVVFSKEPLAPAVLDGDSEWAQVVNWAIFATIQAEEFGITKANVDDFLDSDDPSVMIFLGQAGEDGAVVDPGLGLPVDFAYQVVAQVGNYGEIFDAHLAPLGIERGLNQLWSDGGLLYSPPYR